MIECRQCHVAYVANEFEVCPSCGYEGNPKPSKPTFYTWKVEVCGGYGDNTWERIFYVRTGGLNINVALKRANEALMLDESEKFSDCSIVSIELKD